MSLKIDRLLHAARQQPSIPLIILGGKWMLNWRWWRWWWFFKINWRQVYFLAKVRNNTENCCRTPSWIVCTLHQLQKMASKQSFRTLNVRYAPNFKFEIYSFWEWIKQLFKMAAGRHLEYFGPCITGKSWQINTQTDELIMVFECI